MLTPPSFGVRRLRGGVVRREVRRRAHNHCSFHDTRNECRGPSGMRRDRKKNPPVAMANYDRSNGRKSSVFLKNKTPGQNQLQEAGIDENRPGGENRDNPCYVVEIAGGGSS